MSTTAASTGETIASNINAELDRLGWDYDRLATESGMTRGRLVSYRADAGRMTMGELWLVAVALGVMPSHLAREEVRA